MVTSQLLHLIMSYHAVNIFFCTELSRRQLKAIVNVHQYTVTCTWPGGRRPTSQWIPERTILTNLILRQVFNQFRSCGALYNDELVKPLPWSQLVSLWEQEYLSSPHVNDSLDIASASTSTIELITPVGINGSLVMGSEVKFKVTLFDVRKEPRVQGGLRRKFCFFVVIFIISFCRNF
uniref:Uncharacterized protein n=1 Tax=Biomphalaria glabrata TaxID=6526 RepID=A0A2C9MA75_BIOGL